MSDKNFKIIFELYRKNNPNARLFKFEKYHVLLINGIKKVFMNQALCIRYLERSL